MVLCIPLYEGSSIDVSVAKVLLLKQVVFLVLFRYLVQIPVTNVLKKVAVHVLEVSLVS